MIKYHQVRSIERYKASLVAQRFSKVYGIDYTKAFTSRIRKELLRIFLAISAMLGMILLQMDIIGAYLKNALG